MPSVPAPIVPARNVVFRPPTAPAPFGEVVSFDVTVEPNSAATSGREYVRVYVADLMVGDSLHIVARHRYWAEPVGDGTHLPRVHSDYIVCTDVGDVLGSAVLTRQRESGLAHSTDPDRAELLVRDRAELGEHVFLPPDVWRPEPEGSVLAPANEFACDLEDALLGAGVTPAGRRVTCEPSAASPSRLTCRESAEVAVNVYAFAGDPYFMVYPPVSEGDRLTPHRVRRRTFDGRLVSAGRLIDAVLDTHARGGLLADLPYAAEPLLSEHELSA